MLHFVLIQLKPAIHSSIEEGLDPVYIRDTDCDEMMRRYNVLNE